MTVNAAFAIISTPPHGYRAVPRRPGPDGDALHEMLTIASRVPTTASWRHGGSSFSRGGAERPARCWRTCCAREPDAGEDRLEAERTRFLPAPLTVG